jgi:catechol 2,3-dioxygenase-like lactoylglutathione lyase family enzyme
MSLKDAPMYPSLPAKDIERAKRWYEEKLGLTPAMDLGPGGQLYSSGGSPFVIYQTPAAGTGKQTVGAFIVPDLEATMRELQGKGVKFEDYDLGDQGPTTENGIARDASGALIAWFTDSEGNILALNQVPAGMSMPGAAS